MQRPVGFEELVRPGHRWIPAGQDRLPRLGKQTNHRVETRRRLVLNAVPDELEHAPQARVLGHGGQHRLGLCKPVGHVVEVFLVEVQKRVATEERIVLRRVHGAEQVVPVQQRRL